MKNKTKKKIRFILKNYPEYPTAAALGNLKRLVRPDLKEFVYGIFKLYQFETKHGVELDFKKWSQNISRRY